MEFIKGYKENKSLRDSFNELAESTFGINFEEWYQNGFWNERYIPYSYLDNGEIVANVSVNLMDFNFNGESKKLIQLGTVMTKEGYRHKGLMRSLINEIETEYNGKIDGYFLFANDSVLEFYPKLGYKKVLEYENYKLIYEENEMIAIKLEMNSKEEWDKFINVINNSISNGRFEMIDGSYLIMFYISSFMQDNVYYVNSEDAYVIAEIEEDNLLIHQVFSKNEVNMEEVIKAFGAVKKVTFGYTPKNIENIQTKILNEEDTTLFVKGSFFDKFENNKLMFPLLSHA